MEQKAYSLLKKSRRKITIQQYRTIKGQIKKGDYEGAIKGIQRLTHPGTI